jgi:hypothetical protein
VGRSDGERKRTQEGHEIKEKVEVGWKRIGSDSSNSAK